MIFSLELKIATAQRVNPAVALNLGYEFGHGTRFLEPAVYVHMFPQVPHVCLCVRVLTCTVCSFLEKPWPVSKELNHTNFCLAKGFEDSRPVAVSMYDPEQQIPLRCKHNNNRVIQVCTAEGTPGQLFGTARSK